MSKVTMQTIADLAGVTRTTVSRVLHRPDQVAQQTREHVQKFLQEQGYVYHAAAADLTRGRMSTIALLLPTIRSNAFAGTILTMQEAAQSRDMCVVLGSTEYDPDREARLLQQFRERRLAGGILVGFCPSNEALLHKLNSEGIPIIVIWEKLSVPNISYVGFDNTAASENALTHLISLGHRRIGLLIGPAQFSSRAHARLVGCQRALEKHGIPFDPSLLRTSLPSMREGAVGLRRLMELRPRPTAIFGASDALAIGAIKAATRMGLRIPEDLAVMGFDGTEQGFYMTPELTTVKIPERAMIGLAFKILMEKISSERDRHFSRILRTRLIIRRSCGARTHGSRPDISF